MINARKIANEFFDDLRHRGFVPEEDIAWVGVPLKFLLTFEQDLQRCPVRDCFYTVIDGVEFRQQSRKNSEDTKLEGWFAWNITARTKKLFNKKAES